MTDGQETAGTSPFQVLDTLTEVLPGACVSHNEILRTIFDHIPAMIAMVDRENRFLAINREFERVLGCSEKDVLGRNDILKEWLPDGEKRLAGMEFVQRAEGTWQEFTVMVRGRRIDTVWTNIRLSDGRIISFGQDATERKLAEQAAMQTLERLDNLTECDYSRGNVYGLTFREIGVLRLVTEGNTDCEVARVLGISMRTAQGHVGNILRKMRATTRTGAGVRAVREGLIG